MYVDFDGVLAEAISVIGASGDDEVAKNFGRQWIWRCVTDFPVSEDNIKVCRIDVKNLLLKKPSEMQRFLEVALYDVNDNFIPHVFHTGQKRIYPNVESYSYNVVLNEGEDDEETVTYTAPVDLSEDRNSFVLGTNGSNVSYAQVRYFAYPLDNNGLPMIREEEVLACVYFVRFMWSLRKNDNQSEIRNNELLYKQEADRVRAKRKSMDFSNEKRKQIAASLNRMLPNFNRSRF